MKQEYIRVGRIVNAHGIRGEVRVQPRRVSPPFSPAAKPFILTVKPSPPPPTTSIRTWSC